MSRRDTTTTKVFIGSLPSEVTPDDLRKLFGPYGKIVECDIANRCGFLHLEDRNLAEKAINDLNGTNFMGTKISVQKGRVKPPKTARRDRDNVRGGSGGRNRGGPYSHGDGHGRGSRNGIINYGSGMGRDYDYNRQSGYDRGAPRDYSGQNDNYADRRPLYDDRHREYGDDRRGYASNGYGRSYDNRMNNSDSRSGYDSRITYDRSGYDDRRYASYSNEDDRRPPPPADHRPIHELSRSGYDRNATSNDIYSRRGDPSAKTVTNYGERDAYGSYGNSGFGEVYNSSGTYGSNLSHGYGAAGNSGGYGSAGGYGNSYDGSSAVPNTGQATYASGAYGNGNDTYSGPAEYNIQSSYGGATGGYENATGAYGSAMGTYNTGAYGSTDTTSGYAVPPANATYGSAAPTGYGNPYGGNRGSYDTSYSPQSRSFSSSGMGRERDSYRALTSAADRRY